MWVCGTQPCVNEKKRHTLGTQTQRECICREACNGLTMSRAYASCGAGGAYEVHVRPASARAMTGGPYRSSRSMPVRDAAIEAALSALPRVRARGRRPCQASSAGLLAHRLGR